MAEIQERFKIDRDRLYEGIDSTHTPRLIIPEKYVANRSRRLQKLTAWALLSSHVDKSTQYDVVWTGRRAGPLLRAEIQPTGTFNDEFGQSVEGSDDFFLVDVSWIETGIRSFTYAGQIESALENGAQIFKPSDLGRDFE